jgi:hypothetical protein
LEQLWERFETDNMPGIQNQISNSLIKFFYTALEKGDIPLAEWKQITSALPDLGTNSEEREEWSWTDGKQQKTGNTVANVPTTPKQWEKRVRLHNGGLRFVLNAFRSDPKLDLRKEHFDEIEAYLFGEYILNRSPEPPVKLLRDVERQLWRQAHIEMKKNGKTMAEAIKSIMTNNMFWHTHFLEHLPNTRSKGAGKAGGEIARRHPFKRQRGAWKAQTQPHNANKPYKGKGKGKRNYKGKGKGKYGGKGKGKYGGKAKNGGKDKFKGKASNKTKDKKPRWMATRDPNDKLYCMNFHLRTCKEGQNCWRSHNCNVLKPDGYPCNSRDHTVMNCPHLPTGATIE